MLSEEERKQLVELFTKRQYIALNEIRMHFGKQCSLNAIYKIVKALGLWLKNSQREGAGARTSYTHDKKWKISQKNKEYMKPLVFLGEFGVRNNMDTSLWTCPQR